MLKNISSRRRGPKVHTIELTFPTTHVSILKHFRSELHALAIRFRQNPTSADLPRIVVIVDAIISLPGCVMPWEAMCEICKEEGVISIVDAAHAIGQVQVKLSESTCDFWLAVRF